MITEDGLMCARCNMITSFNNVRKIKSIVREAAEKAREEWWESRDNSQEACDRRDGIIRVGEDWYYADHVLVDEICLTVRTNRALKQYGLSVFRQVRELTREDLAKIKKQVNVGTKTIQEIEELIDRWRRCNGGEALALDKWGTQRAYKA